MKDIRIATEEAQRLCRNRGFFVEVYMQECRQCARWQINTPAVIQRGVESDVVDCKIEDINIKGLKMRYPGELKTGSSLALRILFSPEFCMDIEAVVLWNKAVGSETQCGLSFTKINGADKERIYRFVCRNYPKEIAKQLW